MYVTMRSPRPGTTPLAYCRKTAKLVSSGHFRAESPGCVVFVIQEGRVKILVIDDSTTMRLIIARTLKELGHEVLQAGNGKEGLDAARGQEGLSLVFVDWNMPEMNGYDFVVAARSDSKLKAVPIVMITTENEAENVKKALQAGANEFIMKPFTKEAIQEKMALVGAA